MTMVYEWNTGYCEYDIEDDQQGQVKVTTLHWNCEAWDDAYTGYPHAKSIGTVDASEQSRVYTLPALEAVPASVMTGWVKQALGDEAVQEIEDNLLAQYNELVAPTKGGLTPSE